MKVTKSSNKYFDQMRMYNRHFQIFFTTLLVLAVSAWGVIPDLLYPETPNYKTEKCILKNTRVDSEDYYKNLIKYTRKTLVLEMTEGMEWYISEGYSEYWAKLQEQQNIGKTLTLYWTENDSYHNNPNQIEIAGEKIYAPSPKNNYVAYFLLALTVGFLIYSIYLIIGYFKK